MALKSTERRIDELELEIASISALTDGDKGDITVSSSGTVWFIDNLAVTDAKINDVSAIKVTEDSTHRFVTDTEKSTWNSKQDSLVSGTNIKTINSNSLLGSGNISVQETLVSGTNIKTINSISLLGSGDIAISSGITIGTTAITSGTSTRILFENGSNVVSQSAKLTFNSSTNEFQAGFRVIAGTNGMTDTGGALYVYAGNANDFVSRWFNTSGINIMTLRTSGNGGRLALCNSTGQEGIILNGIFSDALTFGAGRDIYFDTATGTKIGASTSQKFAFWNKTPIVQPTTAVGSATRAGSGGTNLTTNTTFDGYTLAQVVLALRNVGLLA